ncbi:hypothetical protein A0H81_05103 [Grifola frondosa]|uniref:Uncharacterized protein n=1 Tax=Grifola frondosa TaxID=5627 RepID=A0A1C7MD73_GRIFR|nr:hypothetical protein A0H81_05103 [Grifola frondosa]
MHNFSRRTSWDSRSVYAPEFSSRRRTRIFLLCIAVSNLNGHASGLSTLDVIPVQASVCDTSRPDCPAGLHVLSVFFQSKLNAGQGPG